jgi:hypothetical protein
VREVFSEAYLAQDGGKPAHVSGDKPVALEGEALVRRALASRRVASALSAVDGWPQAVVAVPVLLPRAGQLPVLLLAQPLDAAALGQIAERLQEAALLSDGKRALLGAGPAALTARLKRAIGHEAEGPLYAPEPRSWAVARTELAPGLWLLSHVDGAAIVARSAGGFVVVRAAIAITGGALFLLVLFSLRRGQKGRAAGGVGSVGRYVLLHRLGGGGMAEVHLAVALGESGFRRPCVVKRLRPELADNPLAVAQFTDEATLASSLVHANIVPIYDFGKLGNQYFLVEEYIAGRDLGQLVREARKAKRALPPELFTYIAVETLKALDYAHNKRAHDGQPLGLVHRDVSPENIMISVRGDVRLLDFGVLKSAARPEADAGALKGNLAFMSPEQARSADVDARADLFSLGLVLYFGLTGEPLYPPPAGYDQRGKVAAGPGPAELAKIARLPPPFPGVLQNAIAPWAADRYPSAQAFAAALGPPAEGAQATLAALVSELFGRQLREEQQHLATMSSSIRTRGAPPETIDVGPHTLPTVVSPTMQSRVRR